MQEESYRAPVPLREGDVPQSEPDKSSQFTRETATLPYSATPSASALSPSSSDNLTTEAQNGSAILKTQIQLLRTITTRAQSSKVASEIIAIVLDELQPLFPDLRVAHTLVTNSALRITASVQPRSMTDIAGAHWEGPLATEYKAIVEQQPALVVADISADPRLNALKGTYAAMQTAAILTTPMHTNSKISGLLCLHSPRPREWSAWDIEILSDAAAQLSLLLQNANAYTEWRNAERALRKSNKRIGNILDSITDGFMALDRDFTITFVNARAEELMQMPRAGIVGKNLIDIYPEMSRFQFYEHLNNTVARQVATQFEEYYDNTRQWLEISMYPSQDGISLYTRDVTAHKRAEEGLQLGLEKLQRSLNGIVQAMSFAVEIRDPYTAGHQKRVSILACEISRMMRLPAEQIENIRIAGLLHDIGKIAIPAEIMSRPGLLTPPEISIIQTHAQVGYNILKDIEFSGPVALVALQHHERMDGSGYPNGLMGEEIIFEAQIMAVADVIEAMASHRPYRPALGLQIAIEEVLKYEGVRYNSEAVEACFQVFRRNGFDFEQLIKERSEKSR